MSTLGGGRSLHPVVLWSQTKETLCLNVQLSEPRDHQLEADETQVRVKATGKGAHGLANYAFKLDLYSNLDTVT